MRRLWKSFRNLMCFSCLRAADGPQSVILNQVTFGIAVRMAVMGIVAGNND